MFAHRFVASMISMAVTVLSVCGASAQQYPTKLIRIVSSESGGNTDTLSRLIAPGLSSTFGQPVVVENRAGSLIAVQTVGSAAPDGYTLLVTSSSLWIAPLLQKMPYDPITDFLPVVMLQEAPNVLVVNPSLPVNSIKELIALAKARPGEINYASGPTGSSSHLASELLRSMAGIDIVRVPYKGGGPATTAVISGEVQLAILPPATVSQHIVSGRLKALAVTSAQSTALLPQVPTMAASGLPGYEAVERIGIFAPAKTPAAIINRLNQETLRIINQGDLKEVFNAGLASIDRSPEAYVVAIKSSMLTMGKLIKNLGLSLNDQK